MRGSRNVLHDCLMKSDHSPIHGNAMEEVARDINLLRFGRFKTAYDLAFTIGAVQFDASGSYLGKSSIVGDS